MSWSRIDTVSSCLSGRAFSGSALGSEETDQLSLSDLLSYCSCCCLLLDSRPSKSSIVVWGMGSGSFLLLEPARFLWRDSFTVCSYFCIKAGGFRLAGSRTVKAEGASS
jgi:hypothetical protein